jgi:hypothetical protein
MKEKKMRRLSTFFVVLVLFATPLSVLAASTPQTSPPLSRQGELSGTIVYTADAIDTNEDGSIDAADNDIMFSVDVGADPEAGRFQMAGGPPASAAYPRLTQDYEIVLCHAFVDINGDGVVDHNTDAPFVAAGNTDGTDVTPLVEPGSSASFQASWSPDESLIVFAYAADDTDEDGAVTINDRMHLAILEVGEYDLAAGSAAPQLATGALPTVLTDDTISVAHPQFWSESVLLFEATDVATETQGVYMYDLAAEALTLLKGDAWNPIPSSDGTQIAVESLTEEGSTIWIYNVADDTWTILDFEVASAPTWSPDGATLAFAVRADEGSSIVVFDGEGAETVAESSGELSMTSFSPGGEALAFATTPSEGGNVALNVVSLDGAFAATVTPADTNLVEFVWAPPASGGDEASSVPNTDTTSSFTWLPIADLPSNRA